MVAFYRKNYTDKILMKYYIKIKHLIFEELFQFRKIKKIQPVDSDVDSNIFVGLM